MHTFSNCIFSAIRGNDSQADARQAYIQPKLEDDVYIFVTIPEEMWNDEMKKMQPRALTTQYFALEDHSMAGPGVATFGKVTWTPN